MPPASATTRARRIPAPHLGRLWTASGTLLATATFTGETASGWQQVDLTPPVPLTAGATYIASYHTNGFYSATSNYFTTALTNGSLTGPASAASGGNGVFSYGPGGSFPAGSFNATNYWVDVVVQTAPDEARASRGRPATAQRAAAQRGSVLELSEDREALR
jgi:hypothetical protein